MAKKVKKVKSGKMIKVKITQMYYDGIRRHREGSVISIDESNFSASCMVKLVAKAAGAPAASKAKSMKAKAEEVADETVEIFEDEEPVSSPDEDVLV